MLVNRNQFSAASILALTYICIQVSTKIPLNSLVNNYLIIFFLQEPKQMHDGISRTQQYKV